MSHQQADPEHIPDASTAPDLLELRERYLRSGETSPVIRPVVLEAWKRCLEYGVSPWALNRQVVDEESLHRAREENEGLITTAEPVLAAMHEALSETAHVAAVSDRNGYILRLVSAHVSQELCEATNMFEGASWHERDIGCNGAGTCLAIGQPLVLVGPEHFQDAYIDWTCIGIPLKGPEGEILGALDLSVPNENIETDTWGWILSLASDLEARLAGASEQGARPSGSGSDRIYDSLIGILDLLVAQLNLPATHARFIEEARLAALEALKDQRRARKESHINEEGYRLVNQATNDVIWDLDIETGKLLWNEALVSTFGYSPTEIPNTLDWWYDNIHPDDRTRVSDSFDATIADPAAGSWWCEYRFRHADGGWVHVLDRARISRDNRGQGTRMIGSMVDLTERVRREEELHLAVQRFETLANMMPQIVWTTTPDGYHEYFNERWYEFTGMPREGRQGWNWRNYLHPDDVEKTMETWNHSLATGEPYEVQYRFRRESDGAYRWFIGRAIPIRNRKGEIMRWFGTCTDIEDQRREEAKLEALVAERTARLEKQAIQLRHLAAELGSAEQRERRRLAALLHDDLQQVLVAARLHIATAEKHIQNEDGVRTLEQAQKWLDEAVSTARNLSRELRPPALYEGGLAAALRWLASEMQDRHQLTVRINALDSEPDITDDVKALLFECVREVLFNTAKHAGVNEARVILQERPNGLHLAISDRGRGLDVSTIMDQESARGSAFFSIRERLAALGGELTIKSAPGKGTTVEIDAPLALRPEKPPPTPLVPVKSGGRRRPGVTTDHRIRVLVVDDHAVVREGIAAILDSDKRLVVVGQAADGIEAIEAAGRHHPDVMLIDLNMPRMNGILATREIREKWPDIAVVGLSVQDDDSTAQSMLDAGATVFLPKAGDSDKMIATILELAARKV